MANPWDENAEYRHNQILSGKDLTFTKLMVPALLETIRSCDNYKSFSLLEVGCGTGILTRIISKVVHSVVGIDASDESCRIARNFLIDDRNVIVSSSKIEELINDYMGYFDMVLAHMVFHTIDRLDEGFVNISSYLKDQGKFVFSIPHPCFFSSYKDDIQNNGYKYIELSAHEIDFVISNDLSPLPRRVPYFHRPLSFYFDLLWRTGFVIERILEPFPDQELLHEYRTNWNLPRYMIFVCRKLYKGDSKHEH